MNAIDTIRGVSAKMRQGRQLEVEDWARLEDAADWLERRLGNVRDEELRSHEDSAMLTLAENGRRQLEIRVNIAIKELKALRDERDRLRTMIDRATAGARAIVSHLNPANAFKQGYGLGGKLEMFSPGEPLHTVFEPKDG